MLGQEPGAWAWVGVGLGSWVGRLVRRLASFIPHDLAQLICPRHPGSPRVPAEQAEKEGAGGQLRWGRSWLPVPSGFASIDLEPVRIFLTRLLGHLGQL